MSMLANIAMIVHTVRAPLLSARKHLKFTGLAHNFPADPAVWLRIPIRDGYS
jgi:hypothetical protein